MDDNITGKRREVMRWRIERNEGWRGDEEVVKQVLKRRFEGRG